MKSERLNNLSGHSVLLVESRKLLGEMFAEGYVTHEMKPIEAKEFVPENLLEFMNKNGLESAIIHTALLQDEQLILEAHRRGKKIVVIERDPPATTDEADMYQRLESEGIATTPKRLFSQSAAFTLLSSLFENNA